MGEIPVKGTGTGAREGRGEPGDCDVHLSPVKEGEWEEFGQEESQATVLFQKSLGQTSGKSSSQSCPSEESYIL